MKDWYRKSLGYICWEARGTRISYRRGEANLIVDDYVNGSASGISLQTRKIS